MILGVFFRCKRLLDGLPYLGIPIPTNGAQRLNNLLSDFLVWAISVQGKSVYGKPVHGKSVHWKTVHGKSRTIKY